MKGERKLEEGVMKIGICDGKVDGKHKDQDGLKKHGSNQGR